MPSSSFSADAVLCYGFADDKDDVTFITPGSSIINVVADFSTMTYDATDPVHFYDFGTSTAVSGWIGLDIQSTINLRIYTIETPDGMGDTVLGIWGPRETAPGYLDNPWHLADDNLPGAMASLHRAGGSYEHGTDYLLGDDDATDNRRIGLELTPGKYWVAARPYSSVYGGPMRLVLEQVFIASSVIQAPRVTSFTADADVAAHRFFADAWIIGGRWRHHRLRDHYGADSDLYVVLESAVGPWPTDTPVHYVLQDIMNRLTYLETHNPPVKLNFTADAVLAAEPVPDGTFTADAVFGESFGSIFFIDAIIGENKIFTADAYIIGDRTITVDAFIV